MSISVIPLKIDKNIQPGDNLSELIIKFTRLNNLEICDNDILVIAQKIVSKSEQRLRNLDTINPSHKAIEISQIHDKDPRLIELILSESIQILRITKKNLIVETKHGFICANAGIDQSNVSNDSALLLPENPDKSAKKLRESIHHLTKKTVSVIISDTFGRPFRKGQTNIAIGIAGINSLKSYIGKADSYGKKLRVTEIAVVDELASAAELVMGKTLQIPVAIIRGFEYEPVPLSLDLDNSIKSIIREKQDDLFRN